MCCELGGVAELVGRGLLSWALIARWGGGVVSWEGAVALGGCCALGEAVFMRLWRSCEESSGSRCEVTG